MPVLAVGALCMCCGVALIGQVSHPWQLYGCFVFVGIGWATLSTTGLSATVAPWFERHQGRSMTLAIMGASVGAMLGVPALLHAVSTLGLSRGLGAAALVAAVILLPLILYVLRFSRPEQLGLERDGGSSESESSASRAAILPVAESGRPRILLWSAASGFALGLMMQIGFATHHVALAIPLMSTRDAGLLVSATGLTAFIGRLVLARIVDHVPVRMLAAAAMVVQSLSLLAVALWPSVEVLVVASLFYGYCVGHVTTLGPVVVRREFGAQAFARTYGSAATLIQFTSAMGPAVYGFMRDAFGGYGPGMAIAAGVTLLGALCLIAGGRWGQSPSQIN
jgi:MFS family permease